MVSKRIEEYGLRAVPGDLVLKGGKILTRLHDADRETLPCSADRVLFPLISLAIAMKASSDFIRTQILQPSLFGGDWPLKVCQVC